MSKYYITTPIYYVNDSPHIGTAYCTIAADAIARYQRMKGNKVFFVTGTDENGLKVAEAGQRQGLEPQAFVDKMSAVFADTWRKLDVTYDVFIRTTEDRHRRAVQELVKRIYDNGDIYQGTYEGWYCVSDETFFRESELVDGRCPNPECRKEVEWLGEKGYFFRLSKYANALLEYIESHPDFLLPETRKNEVLAFIRGGLKDACISRLSTWGTPLPADLPDAEGMVVYVWFDALVNYLTALGFPDNTADVTEYWPADFHLVGKEIFVRFHATMWPAMLMAAGLPLPKTVFGHGWLTVDGEKMSKSKGNVLHPLKLIEEVSEVSGCSREMALDTLRYYLLRDISFGSDGDCSITGVLGRFNADLANDLGNLLNRFLPLVTRFNEGHIPAPATDEHVSSAAKEAVKAWEKSLDRYDFNAALKSIWVFLGVLNTWIDTKAPWNLAKQGEKEELARVLYCLAEGQRIVAGMIAPIMPNTSKEILRRLGVTFEAEQLKLTDLSTWGQLPENAKIVIDSPLFPRVDMKKK